MIILKKKHDLVVNNLERKVEYLEGVDANRLMKINRLQSDLKNEIEINRNNALIIVEERAKVNQLEETNHELHQEVDQYQEQVKKLEEKLELYRNTVDDLGKVYNSMNRKLWANHEAQRQMRKLSDHLLEVDKVNKANLSKYIYDLAMLVGGGEQFEYAGLKVAEETESVV